MADEVPLVFNMQRVEPRSNPAGSVVEARFSCRVRGFLLLGVKLVRESDGRLAVTNVVSGGGASGNGRGVVLEDEGLRASILTAAAMALNDAPPLDPDAPRRHRGGRSARPRDPAVSAGTRVVEALAPFSARGRKPGNGRQQLPVTPGFASKFRDLGVADPVTQQQ